MAGAPTATEEEHNFVILSSTHSIPSASVQVSHRQETELDSTPLPPPNTPAVEDVPHPLFNLQGDYANRKTSHHAQLEEMEETDKLSPLPSVSVPARLQGQPITILTDQGVHPFPKSPPVSPVSQSSELPTVFEHEERIPSIPRIREMEDDEDDGKLFWTHSSSVSRELSQSQQSQLESVCAKNDNASLIAKARDLAGEAIDYAHKTESMEERPLNQESQKHSLPESHGTSEPELLKLHCAGPATVKLTTGDAQRNTTSSPVVIAEADSTSDSPPLTPPLKHPGFTMPPPFPTDQDGLPIYLNPRRAEWFLSEPRAWNPKLERTPSDGPIRWIDSESIVSYHMDKPNGHEKKTRFVSDDKKKAPSLSPSSIKSHLGRVLPSFRAIGLPKRSRSKEAEAAASRELPRSRAAEIDTRFYEEIPARTSNGHSAHRTVSEQHISFTEDHLVELERTETPPPLPDRSLPKSILKSTNYQPPTFASSGTIQLVSENLSPIERIKEPERSVESKPSYQERLYQGRYAKRTVAPRKPDWTPPRSTSSSALQDRSLYASTTSQLYEKPIEDRVSVDFAAIAAGEEGGMAAVTPLILPPLILTPSTEPSPLQIQRSMTAAIPYPIPPKKDP